MFGFGSFGQLAFAEPACTSSGRRRRGGRGLIGGEGFPPGWVAGLTGQLADEERRRREREEREIRDLIELGVL